MKKRSAVVGLGLALVAGAVLLWMWLGREGGARGVEPALDERSSVEPTPAEIDALAVEPRVPEPAAARLVADASQPLVPPAPVEPGFGAVEVQVLDELGNAAPPGSCGLRLLTEGGRSRSDFDYERLSSSGSALFQRVPLRVDIEIRAHADPTIDPIDLQSILDEGMSSAEADPLGAEMDFYSVNREATRIVPGPTRAGETVFYMIRLGEDRPVLVFRAVDASGTPIRNESIRVVAPPNYRGVLMRTGDRGEALLHLGIGEKGKLELRRPTTGDTAEIETASYVEPGVHDVGAVVFGAGAPLVAGVVVDEHGNPLEAKLYAASRRSAEWVDNTEELGRSGKDGRFDFRGKDELVLNLELAAFRPGFAGPAVPFQRGDSGVRVVLSAEGAIEGRLVPLPGMNPGDYGIVVLRPGEVPGQKSTLSKPESYWGTTPGKDGSFRIGELVPGEYTLRVGESSSSREFAKVTGLFVKGGQTTRDPRLDPLRLAGEYTHIIGVRAEGASILSGTLHYGPAGAAELGSTVRFMERPGACRLVVTGSDEVIDVEVAMSGFRLERRNGVRGVAEIEMRPGWQVRLVLNADGELPVPPHFVGAALVPTRLGERATASPFTGYARFDARGEGVAYAMEPGPSRIQWRASLDHGDGVRSSGVRLDREVIVEVFDVEGEQRIEIALTAEELAKLVSTP